jgi:cytochrome c-type biogenesis protein CcmF
MTVLGNLVLVLGLLTSALAAVFFYRGATGHAERTRVARQMVKVHVVFIAFSSLLLLVQILAHDFSNGYVFSYSDRALPLFYLLSSFYAGQQGSFLFWALCSSILAVLVHPYTTKRRTEYQVMAVFMAVQSLLLILVLAKSPFVSVWSLFPDIPIGTIPSDGRGLNPLLQNFWMVIHPPVLFIGFAAMAIPFAFTIAGLWKREDDLLVGQGLPWVLFATSSLGLGIMLGGYWAYGVLGWGGYWGWDPVENSSLVPWLTSMGMLHTLLAQRRTGKFIRTNYLLAIISFALVIYSTFLTRSGILGDASVHSFTDPGTLIYWLLLAILALVGGGGLVLLASRWKQLRPESTGSEIFTREMALGAGTLALLLSAVVVLFGTSLPIVSKIRVEGSFYDGTNLPIAIAMGLLIGISLYLQWEEQELVQALRRAWIVAVAAIVVTVIVVVLGMRDVMIAGLFFASVFALFVNLDIAVRVARGNWRVLGGKAAHIGVALFLLGVIGSGRYNSSEHAALPLGRSQQVLGHTMTYKGSRQLPDGKIAFDVQVQSSGSGFVLSPVMFNTEQQGIMRNPDIASFAFRDLYLSPVSLSGGEPATAGPPRELSLHKGEATKVGQSTVTLTGFDMSGHGAETVKGEMPIGVVLNVNDGATTESVKPMTVFGVKGPIRFHSVESRLLKGLVKLVAVEAGVGGGSSTVILELQALDGSVQQPETLVVEASVKPFINLVWIGTLIMMVGYLLSIVTRSKES